MKLLTAAPIGPEESDYAHTIPGELVDVGGATECMHPVECGCDRSFSGIVSGKSCSRALVAEITVSPNELALILIDLYKRLGWPDRRDQARIARQHARALVALAEPFTIGTYIRRSFQTISAARS